MAINIVFGRRVHRVEEIEYFHNLTQVYLDSENKAVVKCRDCGTVWGLFENEYPSMPKSKRYRIEAEIFENGSDSCRERYLKG